MKENGEKHGCSDGVQMNKGMHYKEAMKVYHTYLKSYELKEIDNFHTVYYVGQKCANKVNALMTNSAKSAYTNANGEANLLMGDHIAYRYEVMGFLGCGTFGRVVSARDHATGSLVAIKVINKDKKLAKMARQEIEMMQHIQSKDSAGKYGVLGLMDSFVFRDHTCIVMEQLGRSLYDQLKIQKFEPMSFDTIRVIAARLLVSLAFLWRENIVHCDIKPENILLGSSNQVDVKLVDLGSAFFDTSKRYDYVQSRYYRAPEIILGINSHRPIDLWSYACVLCELATGTPIFPGDTPQDQLGCIIEYLGAPPSSMISACRKKSQYFNKDGSPKLGQTPEGEQRRSESQSLAHFLEVEESHPFISFVRQFLEWDPKKRVEPLQAMQHPWIREEFEISSPSMRRAATATAQRAEKENPVAAKPADVEELLVSTGSSRARRDSVDMPSNDLSNLCSLYPLSPYARSTMDEAMNAHSKATAFQSPSSSVLASPEKNTIEDIKISVTAKPAPVAPVKPVDAAPAAPAAAAVVKPAPVAPAKPVDAAPAAAVVKPAPVAPAKPVDAATAAAVVKPAPVAPVKPVDAAPAAAAVVKPAPVAPVKPVDAAPAAPAATAVVKPAPVASAKPVDAATAAPAADVVKPAPVAPAKPVDAAPAAAVVVKPAPVAPAKPVDAAPAAAAVVKPAPVAPVKPVDAAPAAAAVVKPAPVAPVKPVDAATAAPAAAVVKPAPVAPAKPVDAAPAAPAATAVVKPAPVAPVKPVDAAPAATAVVKPAPVAPVKPVDAAPAAPAAAAAVVKPAPVAPAKPVDAAPAAPAATVVKPAPVAPAKPLDAAPAAPAAAAVVKPAPVAPAKPVDAAPAAAVVKPAPVASAKPVDAATAAPAADVVKPAPVAPAKPVDAAPAAAVVVKPAPVAPAKPVDAAPAAAAVVKPAPVAPVKPVDAAPAAPAATAVVKPAPVAPVKPVAVDVMVTAAVNTNQDTRRRSSIQERISQFENLTQNKSGTARSCVTVSNLSSVLPPIAQANSPLSCKTSVPSITHESVLEKSKLFMHNDVKPIKESNVSVIHPVRTERNKCDEASTNATLVRLPSLPVVRNISEITQRRHTRRRIASLPNDGSADQEGISPSPHFRPRPVRRVDPTSATTAAAVS